jgi:hypothetical protein
MLSEQAIALIRDVFEQPDLFRSAPRIGKRVVAWGPGAEPLLMEHFAVVVSEDSLLDSIEPAIPAEGSPNQTALWTILAAKPLPAPAVEWCFGSRMAVAAPVTLKPNSPPGACWIESLENGWLFLVPDTPTSGWLLAVGEGTEALFRGSRIIAPQIGRLGLASGVFPAHARIATPLCGPGWLACGTAAIAFDPICGDGTGQAIREAILASAVIRAIRNGGCSSDLLSHYEARLTAGFRRHLSLCRGFYQSGGTSQVWRSEVEAIDRGIHWCDAKLRDHVGFRFQLRGFELEATR